jgi:hypothetical protein
VIEDLIKASMPLLKFGDGFAEILYLLVLFQALVFLVLKLLFEEGVCGQRFLELLLQPTHRNGVALLHPLKCGLELGSICMAEISAWHWLSKHKGTQNLLR